MRVLIACESSGVERDAFLALGHDAMSCDLLQTESGPHYQGDVRDLMGERWDLVIAHPPCTYLANAGARWLYEKGTRIRVPERWADLDAGAAFFALMFEFRTEMLCVENPVQHIHAVQRHGQGRATQTVQPWQFGTMEKKRTCYWLRGGLPPLRGTLNVKAETDALPKKLSQRVFYASPSPDRWQKRSKSDSLIAAAMADQWGRL